MDETPLLMERKYITREEAKEIYPENQSRPRPVPTELSITIKNSEQRYTQKFLLYDTYTFSVADPIIAQCLEQAKQNFCGKDGNEIEDIKIKATLEL